MTSVRPSCPSPQTLGRLGADLPHSLLPPTGIKVAVLRESQRLNGHVPRPPPAPSPPPADVPAAPIDNEDAPPPSFEPVPGAVPGGGIPKLKLTFGGGGKKSSLSALLN